MLGTDETNFPHNLLLTIRQVAGLHKAFTNSSSKYIKLSRTQISKIIESSGILGRLVGPLTIFGLPLMKNVLALLAQSVLVLLESTAAVSIVDIRIHKKY